MATATSLARSAASMAAGDHACLLYASDDDRRAAVSSFVLAGLAAGEKVVYFAGDGEGEELAAGLAAGGVPPSVPLGSGQLEIRGPQRAQMGNGEFDPGEMIESLRRDIASAYADGFNGWRGSGELGWAARSGASADALLDYEERVGELLRDSGTTGLCRYDRRDSHEDVAQEIARVHPLVLAAQGDGSVPPSELLRVGRGPRGGLTLGGEVDQFLTCESLVRSLQAAASRDRELRLDLSELSFIDLAGLRAIGDLAAQLGKRGGRLTLVSPRPMVRKGLALLDLDEALSVVD